MARVVLVHGINNTFGSPAQMAVTWRPALIGGVQLAGGTLAEDDVACAFYGDVFRPPGRFLSGDHAPDLTADDVDDGAELELLMAWWEAAARVDPGVVLPGARTLGGKTSARAAVLALSGSRFLTMVSERMLVWWLRQVTLYFTNPSIREAVQKRLAAAIQPGTRVIVAHSLGSVVAYEALRANPDWTVTDLVTLGSPLGVPHVVFHRLVGGDWPGRVERWVNITDDGDFVALEPRLRKLFGERVTDVAISNGMGAHQVERYLSAAETGAAVMAGLRG